MGERLVCNQEVGGSIPLRSTNYYREFMKLREKLTARMDEIQRIMEANEHLADPEKVKDLLDKVTYAWSVLSEEDRDYIHGVQVALEEKLEWKLD